MCPFGRGLALWSADHPSPVIAQGQPGDKITITGRKRDPPLTVP
jgi:hypothetical protein